MKEIGSFNIEVFKHKVIVYSGLPNYVSKKTIGRCEIDPDKMQVEIYLHPKIYLSEIAHECVHCADFILHNIGAKLETSPSESEVRSYLVEHILENVQKILKKKGKKQ